MKLNGIHHIAVMARDMKEHITFFSEVMGCELEGLFPMHGVPGAIHAFLKLNETCHFSIVQIDAGRDVPIEIGKTHSGTGAGISAPGTMQHIAFGVETKADMLAMRDRLRSKGLVVVGPLDHGMCESMYFAGPDNMTLEIAVKTGGLDKDRWIDPAVLEQLGISDEEAKRFTSPEPTRDRNGTVKQPPYKADGYHQTYPDHVYKAMLAASDEQIMKMASFPEPPVPAR